MGAVEDQRRADVDAAWAAVTGTSYATLKQWATDAKNTTVTSGNAVAVLQTVVTRLGTFFDRFADLLRIYGDV